MIDGLARLSVLISGGVSPPAWVPLVSLLVSVVMPVPCLFGAERHLEQPVG